MTGRARGRVAAIVAKLSTFASSGRDQATGTPDRDTIADIFAPDRALKSFSSLRSASTATGTILPPGRAAMPPSLFSSCLLIAGSPLLTMGTIMRETAATAVDGGGRPPCAHNKRWPPTYGEGPDCRGRGNPRDRGRVPGGRALDRRGCRPPGDAVPRVRRGGTAGARRHGDGRIVPDRPRDEPVPHAFARASRSEPRGRPGHLDSRPDGGHAPGWRARGGLDAHPRGGPSDRATAAWGPRGAPYVGRGDGPEVQRGGPRLDAGGDRAFLPPRR